MRAKKTAACTSRDLPSEKTESALLHGPIANGDFASLWPQEAVNLYYPQSHFFSSPLWGHAFSNVMEGGSQAVPVLVKAR